MGLRIMMPALETDGIEPVEAVDDRADGIGDGCFVAERRRQMARTLPVAWREGPAQSAVR